MEADKMFNLLCVYMSATNAVVLGSIFILSPHLEELRKSRTGTATLFDSLDIPIRTITFL